MAKIKHNKPHILCDEIKHVIAIDQPELEAAIYDKSVIVKGKYHLQPKAGDNLSLGSLDKFDIEIVFDSNFPETEPVVREVGGKIPRSAQYHINDQSGTCCLEVWEVWLANNPNADVKSFFEAPLRNFFLGQIFYKENGRFPFGEHDHYEEGRLAAYSELLECDEKKETITNYLRTLTFSPPRGHWLCPCESGLKIRNCCFDKFLPLGEKIPPALAKSMLKKLKT